MDCDKCTVLAFRYLALGSNPFPFLLWIATLLARISLTVSSGSSNPFPFLLWIATFSHFWDYYSIIIVVTLFHFYCGLRQLLEYVLDEVLVK